MAHLVVAAQRVQRVGRCGVGVGAYYGVACGAAAGAGAGVVFQLQHELLHGHPTRNAAFNRFLGLLPLAVWYPFDEYKRSHLAHHEEAHLTYPGIDPESNYLAPAPSAGCRADCSPCAAPRAPRLAVCCWARRLRLWRPGAMAGVIARSARSGASICCCWP